MCSSGSKFIGFVLAGEKWKADQKALRVSVFPVIKTKKGVKKHVPLPKRSNVTFVPSAESTIFATIQIQPLHSKQFIPAEVEIVV